MPNVMTMPPNVLQDWQFRIEIAGFEAAVFTKGQEPKTEFEEVEIKPAGSIFPLKVAGPAKFEDLTFEKGMLQTSGGAENAALDWIQQQANFEEGTLSDFEAYQKDVDVVRVGRNGDEIKRWTLHGAWIKKHEGADLEGGKKDMSIEKLTICYQYWTKG